ncbi:MAG: N-acetyltransferase family protein [Actinomycetia bacterium]|nr:N-acetyltransferase family protein [Actinomycetes bacterium]
MPVDPAVRAATHADVGSILQIYAPYVAGTSISFECNVPSPEEMGRRIAAEPRLPWLVAETPSEVLGYAYAYPHADRAAYRWTVNCSVYVGAERQRSGIGRLLYVRLLDELRELGYVCAVARITLPNQPSVRLHESVGFTPAGKLKGVGFKGGKWHDVGLWELHLATHPAVPREPTSWAPPG